MNNLEEFLNKYFKKDDNIILACSTGPDSMYLLHKILETSYKDNLVVCYFNHKLRKEADKEEEFIEKLGKKLGFHVEIGTADIKAIHKIIPSKSIEEIAREKRYAFFNAILNIHNSKYILTAHHLDDKIETFFFNLLRGSKITGLINMKEKSGAILRPLLNITKNDILKYLEVNKLKYNIDITNLDKEITRNYLRLDIIPKLGKINSNFKENIGNFMSYLENVKDFIDIEVEKFLIKDGIFSVKEFKNLDLFLQKEVLRYIFFLRNNNSTIGLSESNINEILRFINGKNNKTIKELKMLKMKKDGDKIYY
ncbi:tRNA lysidine(34) synthetase TilS [Candidatus Gracilibacteria bacterium]|nr:tRNA lysidine(34) synthetase TilS [Candidatus Gracilibacteria bacterium]